MEKASKDVPTGSDMKSPAQSAKASPAQSSTLLPADRVYSRITADHDFVPPTDAAPPPMQKSASNATSSSEPGKPLAPPPRPSQQNTSNNTPDYFSNQVGDSLSLEPNPFEQSFGSPPETPGGTKLPSVASLTSPSSLLPGGSTPFNWGGGSLRTGPLSPAMLSGPSDYFGDTHLRGGFPTPNESSLRTGLTPGGSGSMFPAPSPSSQALFSGLQSGGPTPSTLDFHRTAINAAAAQREQQAKQASQANQERKTSLPGVPPQSVTSQPQDLGSPVATTTAAPNIDASKASTGPFDQDSNAANSLFLLAQGRNSAQPQTQFVVPPPPPPQSAPQAMAAQTAVPIPVMGPAGSVAPAAVLAPTGSVVPAAVSLPATTEHHSPRMSNASLTNGMSGPATHGSGDSARDRSSDGSPVSDASEPSRPRTRNKRKRDSSVSEAAPASNGRRKTQQTPTKNGSTAKKAKKGNSPPAEEEEDSNSDDDDDDDSKPGKDGQPKQKMTEEEKRKNFLERNRVAALKCRQRKKQWLNNLQKRVEEYSTENEHLAQQISQLREEVVNLKTLLMAHKDCPVAQQQNLHRAFMQPQMEPYAAAANQLNPYGMQAPVGGQPVIAGQVGPRRFS